MKPILIGHRGFPSRYPENTIASFLAAVYFGADGVELDVWLTSDKKLAVIHDPDTKRVAGEELVVKKSTFDELRRLDLGMGQRIPTLEEVIEAVPAEIPLFVELKDVEASAPAYLLIKERGRLENTAFVSFKQEALRRIRELSREAKLGFIIGSLEGADKALKLADELNLYAVAPPIYGIKYVGKEKFLEYLRKVKENGLRTVVWVVNTEEECQAIKGVADIVVTDNIKYVKQFCGMI